VIGQGRMLLHPTGAADAWDAYRARYIEGCGRPTGRRVAPPPGPSVQIAGSPGGLGLSITF